MIFVKLKNPIQLSKRIWMVSSLIFSRLNNCSAKNDAQNFESFRFQIFKFPRNNRRKYTPRPESQPIETYKLDHFQLWWTALFRYITETPILSWTNVIFIEKRDNQLTTMKRSLNIKLNWLSKIKIQKINQVIKIAQPSNILSFGLYLFSYFNKYFFINL